MVKKLSVNINLILYILFFSISISYAQSPNAITINSKSKLNLLTPGEYYTVLFEVKNNSNTDINLDLEYALPEGFKAILTSKKKTIPSFGKKNILFSFSVNQYCKASDYSIELIAKNKNNIIASEKINLKVTKIFKLDITPTKSPHYLRFEKEFSCEYLIVNKGNSKEKINLESSRSLSINPTTISLSPDSSAVVKVTQAVPSSPYSKSIALNVLSAEIAASGERFSNRIPITVYPNSTKKPDLYFRFPITVSTTFNHLKGLDTINAFTFDINGGGYLDRKKDHYLRFLYSGPNQPELTRFGEYDEYNLLYIYKNLELNAGQISYSLSNLTETSRSGLGAIVKYNFQKYNVSVFYLQPRFTDKISDSYGGEFQWLISQQSLVKFGYINRTIIENEQSLKSQIVNLAALHRRKFLKLYGEIAFETNELTNGFAASLEANYNKYRFQWGNLFQYSDKDYKGYLRDSKQFITNINYQISRKFSAELNATYRSLNPENDTINYSSSPITSTYQAKIRYNLNKNNQIKLGATYREKEDRLEPKKFDFEEKLINLNYTRRKMNRYDLQFYNSFGTSKNFLLENPTPTTAFYSSIDFSMTFFNNLSVGVFGNYEYTSRNSSDSEIQSNIYYGGNLQYNLKNKFDINLFYRSDYAVDIIESDAQSFLEAQINYNFNRNNRFSFSASQSSIPSQDNSLDKELLLTASYYFTINAPLSKDKSKGIIKGKIISNDNDKLEGILVSIKNNAAVTNEKGEFTFYNLIPGEYSLSIAQSSLPKNKIIIEKTPYKLDVLPNIDSYVELTLGKTGRVKGIVELKKLSTVRSNKFEKKLPRIVVKIYNNNDKYLTQTNDKGEFTFLKLAPGEWTVELLVKPLLKDFSFSTTKKTIQIAPDQEILVKFNALINNRNLKKSKKTFKL